MIFGFTLLSVAIWLPIIFGVLVLASAPVLSTTLARIDALFVMFCLTQPIIAILRKWRRSIQTIQVLILVLFSQNSMAVGSVLPVQTTTTPISGYVTQWSNTPVYTTQTESCIASTAALNAAYATPPYFLDSANPYYLSYCHILLPANSGYSGYLANIYVLSAAGCPADATLNGSNQCVSYTCPVNSQKNATPPTACVCDVNFQPDTTGKSCVPVQEEIYTLSLTPEAATLEPNKTYSFMATVTKVGGGAPSQDVPVSVKVEVDSISGGHEHGEKFAKRNKGSIAPASGNAAQPITVTFTATAASGTHTLTATCDLCENKTATAKVNVKVEGLEQIPDSWCYTMIESNGRGGTKVIGATDNHNDNHNLTPAAATVLWSIAASYQMEAKFWQVKKRKRGKRSIDIPPPILHLNDASLKWGGVFDISGKWKPAHEEHRRGTVIDIRANADSNGKPNTGAIPSGDFAEFEKIGLSFGGADAQIHCKKNDGQNRKKPLCIGSNGSQDDNRHYHIRLLGVK